MKTLFKAATLALFITGTTGAQNHIQEIKTTRIESFVNSKEDTITIKTVNHEVQPLLFDTAIDQDLIEPPIYVDKTIYIDNDSDPLFEKEVSVSYILKDVGQELNYVATANGVNIITSHFTSRPVTKEGVHEIEIEGFDNMTVILENITESSEQ